MSNCDAGSQVSAGHSIQLKKDCCGWIGNAPAAISVPDLLSGLFEVPDKISFHAPARLFSASCLELVGIYNKAPPKMKSMGGSDTYLYKRVLLI
jgi:hypothetical protein